MHFNRVNGRLPLLIILASVVLISCSSSPSSPISSNSLPTEQPNQGQDLCGQPPAFELFDLQAAAVIQTLLEGPQLGRRGESGAEQLAGEYLSSTDTFCGMEVPQDLVAALDEIQGLVDSGAEAQADQKLDDLLEAVEADLFSSIPVQKSAAPPVQAGADRIRAKVRSFLAIAGRASYWGNDDKFESAMDSARQTYQGWASDAIDSASIKEAVRIAAEASLLDLDSLRERGLERARDLAELDLMGEIESYQPCTATREDTGRLLDTAALAELLGVDTDPYDYLSDVQEWLEIQQLREKGEDVPQCDVWQVDMVLDHVWDRGSYLITWEGKFKVLEDGTLAGQGQGTHTAHVEVNCLDVMTGEEFMSTTDASGGFTFQIQGDRDQGEFRFLFPAEVEVSGVDTCNEFDETTYLPSYVIEEINVYGGVENYDPDMDTIYMVLPAEDGASQIYETLIGPVELRLSYLGGSSR